VIDIYKKSEIRGLLDSHDFRLSKNFGQNLLIDKNIICKIADALEIEPNDTVLEIGPGFGALTCELTERAGSVVAVEIDRRIIPILEEVTEGAENLRIVNEDFLKFDVSELGGDYKVIGNLPYYITTPIIARMLELSVLPKNMVFMVQKEVAARLLAKPGGRDYGAISVLVAYKSEASYVMDVTRDVFMPKPSVDSAVIVLRPFLRSRVPVTQELFFKVVKAGFGQRRKMLSNSLKVLGISPEALDSAFAAAGVSGSARAETLSVEDFIELSDAIAVVI
jgi:16S rRNA (adenine1518-N6/adenine1519-N6)-dimethyltransferase